MPAGGVMSTQSKGRRRALQGKWTEWRAVTSERHEERLGDWRERKRYLWKNFFRAVGVSPQADS